jgi:hypothetical protein
MIGLIEIIAYTYIVVAVTIVGLDVYVPPETGDPLSESIKLGLSWGFWTGGWTIIALLRKINSPYKRVVEDKFDAALSMMFEKSMR